MDNSWLFWKLLYVIEMIASARYFLWIFFMIIIPTLLVNKFQQLPRFYIVLKISWWVLLSIAFVNTASLVVAYIAKPQDSAAIFFIYDAFLLSLQILIPCLISLFLKPSSQQQS